ncbi:putative histone acetyltransferase [Cyclospora cayetanensis]|uniref:Histone acetyltransferase n=1 Tax=Cyclospora cayetanensis TaxID=88456 RepID=A0A1D3CUP2_9EIME|nr:putative histone acetyltransferase [Cyclospora cayetanensis]
MLEEQQQRQQPREDVSATELQQLYLRCHPLRWHPAAKAARALETGASSLFKPASPSTDPLPARMSVQKGCSSLPQSAGVSTRSAVATKDARASAAGGAVETGDSAAASAAAECLKETGGGLAGGSSSAGSMFGRQQQRDATPEEQTKSRASCISGSLFGAGTEQPAAAAGGHAGATNGFSVFGLSRGETHSATGTSVTGGRTAAAGSAAAEQPLLSGTGTAAKPPGDQTQAQAKVSEEASSSPPQKGLVSEAETVSRTAVSGVSSPDKDETTGKPSRSLFGAAGLKSSAKASFGSLLGGVAPGATHSLVGVTGSLVTQESSAKGKKGAKDAASVAAPAASEAAEATKLAASLPGGGGIAASCEDDDVSGSTSASSSNCEPAGASAASTTPTDYEYYVHYRLTNRRLDCWLPFSDLLPVNAQGRVLPPTSYHRSTGGSCPLPPSLSSPLPHDAAAAAAASLGGGGEHLPKRMKLANGDKGPPPSDATASFPAGKAAESALPPAATANASQEEDADCAAAAAWKQLEAEGNTEAEELKVLLFDPSLVFSDHDEEEHEGMDSATLAAHEEATRVKTINKVFFGGQELDTWYFSPYPAEAQAAQLHICEFCLTFFLKASELQTHSLRCTARHPPGNEIYRDGQLSMFEVDGKTARVYSVGGSPSPENLCFLAKLFLDHKTLQFDVEPFLFYVLTEEKVSLQGYNLACILTLPQHQRKGYGRFLISFSYVLSLKENKRGGPERPLSDLGRLSYIGWWSWRILNLLSEPQWACKKRVSIHELVRATAIRPEDIQRTLEEIGVLRYLQGHHVLLLHPDLIKARLKEAGSGGVPVHPEKLHFAPYHQGAPQPNEAMPLRTAEEDY